METNAFSNWKHITNTESARIKDVLRKGRKAGVTEEHRKCYIFGYRQFLSGVMAAYEGSLNEEEKKKVTQDFDLQIGQLEQEEYEYIRTTAR